MPNLDPFLNVQQNFFYYHEITQMTLEAPWKVIHLLLHTMNNLRETLNASVIRETMDIRNENRFIQNKCHNFKKKIYI